MSVDEQLKEWVLYLKEIGVRDLRIDRAARPVEAPVLASESTPAPRSSPDVRAGAPRPAAAKPSADVPALARQHGLLGGEVADEFTSPPPTDPAAGLEEIRADLGDCTRCPLHEQRTNVVFGVGDPRARLMFIGEGPGADEDAQGEPFVGRAGKKLDQMIESIGLRRQDVYIANIVKCRPPNNRDPKPDEVATCSPFLFRQIETIRPRVIVTLGSPATRTLLKTRTGITRLRGQWHGYRGIPVMPTYHPAYLLRAYTQENRQKVWDDLRAARARMDESE